MNCIKNKWVVKLGLLLLVFSFLPNYTYAESKQATSNIAQVNNTNAKKISISKEDLVFVVDGSKYQSAAQQQPFIYENRTYVSLRFAGYILEKWIDWSQSQKAVTVSTPTDLQLTQLRAFKQQLAVDASAMSETKVNKKSNVNAYLNYGDIVINGKHTQIPNDVTTLLVDGTIFVPLRFLGEILEYKVDFDSKTRSIVINNKSNTETDSNKSSNTTTTNNGNVLPPGGQGTATRESIVGKVESELNSLRDSYIAKGIALYDAYLSTADQDEKAKLYAKGQDLFNEVEAIVNAKLTNLDSDLKANNFEVGSDSSNFRAQFEKQKSALLSQFTK